MKKVYVFLVCAMVICSCEKNSDSNTTEFENLENELILPSSMNGGDLSKGGNELEDPVYGEDFTFTAKVAPPNEGVSIITVNIDLHRPNPRRCLSCQCGLGVCQIQVCIPGCPKGSSNFQFEISQEELITDPSLTFELNNPLDKKFDTNFYVNVDQVAFDNEGTSYKIPEGIYPIDYSIGDFGGYTIPFIMQ